MEERFFYAQIDNDGIVCGVSSLSGEVILPTMIRIESDNADLLGKIWDSKKKIFIENPNKVVENFISVGNLRSKFSLEEMRSLYESEDVMVKILLDEFRTLNSINLDDVKTLGLFDNLVSIGILSEERKTEILST